jgi:hypothetical protein
MKEMRVFLSQSRIVATEGSPVTYLGFYQDRVYSRKCCLEEDVFRLTNEGRVCSFPFSVRCIWIGIVHDILHDILQQFEVSF